MGFLKPKIPAMPPVPTAAEIIAQMPKPAEPEPPPNPATIAVASQSVAAQNSRGAPRRSPTIMTSGQGVSSPSMTTGKTLLGA